MTKTAAIMYTAVDGRVLFRRVIALMGVSSLTMDSHGIVVADDKAIKSSGIEKECKR